MDGEQNDWRLEQGKVVNVGGKGSKSNNEDWLLWGSQKPVGMHSRNARRLKDVGMIDLMKNQVTLIETWKEA